MKKVFLIITALLSVLALNGCADKRTGSDLEFSDSPFTDSNSSQTSETSADDYEELFGKYQTGSTKTSNYSLDDSMEFEYNGGDIEFAFDMSTAGNKYEIEKGFMAFINGIPQKLSLNGGERSELVCVSQKPDKSSTITLSFTPTITEELIDEKKLQVKFINIFNPSYKPSGSFIGFGNAHNGSPFLEFDINVNSSLAVSESDFELIKDKCESVLITDETAKKYKISKPDETRATTLSIIDAQTKEQPLTLHDGKPDAELLMYGSEAYNYRVYFYVNHERVKFNGGDYLETEVKNGYLNVLELELENINERDIVYAVAVPTNSETGSMTVRKSGSALVVGENDIPTDGNNSQSSVESQPVIPPETTEEKPSEFDGITSIYSYHPEGYIDDEQRYLLLSNLSFNQNYSKYHDLIIYDEATQKVTGVLDVDEYPLRWTFGDGVVTVEVSWDAWDVNEDTLHYVVYNEKFEPIRELRDGEIGDLEYIYYPRYLPSQKRWYFNSDNDCFYTANDDFSEITKIADFTVRQYYILEDRIVYYRTIHNNSDPKNNADIFGEMKFDGNIISETKIASDGSGRFRTGKTGDTIYFMSRFRIDTDVVTDVPIDRIIFYDCQTGEQKALYPEDDNENSFCKVTPNGKYLVTGILVKENHYTYKDIIIKLYDIESGKMLESRALGTGKESFLAMCAYNDRVILTNGNSVTYMFKTQ